MSYLNLSQANLQIINNLPSYFIDKTSQERIAFSTMIDCSNRFVSIELSRKRMAATAGVTLRSIDRWKEKWTSLGIIESQHRKSHLKHSSLTNRYALHPVLYDSSVRGSLSEIPEFSLVFKMVPVPRQIVPPYKGRKLHNIRTLSSNTLVDKLNYVSPIKNSSLFGISLLNQSTAFEGTQSSQIEKPPSSSSTLPGYRYDMTPQEKIAYVLARSKTDVLQKSEQPKQQTMPPGLSSYEQGQWIKNNLLNKQTVESQQASRERLEEKAKYEREFVDWRDKQRIMDNIKQNRIYN